MNVLVLLLAVAMVFGGCTQQTDGGATAQSPFVGTWKLNPAKSQFAGTTITYELLPSGELRGTAEGQSYDFKADGKEYPSILSRTG